MNPISAIKCLFIDFIRLNRQRTCHKFNAIPPWSRYAPICQIFKISVLFIVYVNEQMHSLSVTVFHKIVECTFSFCKQIVHLPPCLFDRKQEKSPFFIFKVDLQALGYKAAYCVRLWVIFVANGSSVTSATTVFNGQVSSCTSMSPRKKPIVLLLSVCMYVSRYVQLYVRPKSCVFTSSLTTISQFL